jgi:hypothetical protein
VTRAREIRDAKVLVQGPITLLEKVSLRSILEGIEVLEKVPAPAALDPPESERTEDTQTSP